MLSIRFHFPWLRFFKIRSTTGSKASRLTSATLSTEGSFSFIRERVGLPDAAALQVASPFDYEASTLVAVANDIPEPNQQGHQKMMQRALIEVCRASGGRAMVLFTSHSALQNSYYAIKPALEREGIQVLGQRVDGSPRQLIERLMDVPETVLLGHQFLLGRC